MLSTVTYNVWNWPVFNWRRFSSHYFCYSAIFHFSRSIINWFYGLNQFYLVFLIPNIVKVLSWMSTLQDIKYWLKLKCKLSILLNTLQFHNLYCKTFYISIPWTYQIIKNKWLHSELRSETMINYKHDCLEKKLYLFWVIVLKFHYFH